MEFLDFQSIGDSYPSVAINGRAVLENIRYHYNVVDIDSGSLYAARTKEALFQAFRAGYCGGDGEIELDPNGFDPEWYNTCNWDTAFDMNFQFASVDIGNGAEGYDECLIFLEWNTGDPRGGYRGQCAFVGVLAETGLLESAVQFWATDDDANIALEDLNYGHCGRVDGLDTLLDSKSLPEGYSVVLSEFECPLFEGDDLVMTGPNGRFLVSFRWSGEYCC